ncbi:MAG: efflux RND transporter periplasmic adaptor subunit [Candidatus Omnitrophica bacterium]|nr:efflux RND transporter periplasmic adaptor subunit [Candidatus Omnitrophota bacterium]MBU1923898.1 efflux RND transporter periplasmic adaptor subunit [Candidatus Omnitrophota bacterium]
MNKKTKFYFIAPVFLIVAIFLVIKIWPKTDSGEMSTELNPTLGSIQTIISTTGTVLPKNRLEIKPPVNGRIESVLVKEGQSVKAGEALAWMSSTERAALLDAAQGQGEEKLKYWQEAYKPIALLAPIDGEVIVATTQPGQTISTSDAVIVLSDQLIVRAQVDETDIGKIKLNQKATVSLDAYPDTEIEATVGHIYYESKTVNNVTIYEVDLIPQKVLAFFRSGMNVTIDFIENSRENALLIPLEAVHKEGEESFVILKKSADQEEVKQVIKVGIADDENMEILSGLSINDRVVVKEKKYVLPKSSTGTNPFMPSRNKKEAKSQ